MEAGSHYGFSGQEYENFLCMSKECKAQKKEREKEKYSMKMEKEKLKLEERKLKNDKRRVSNDKKTAETEASRAQVKLDEKMQDTMTAQLSAPPPSAGESKPKKDNTLMIVGFAVAGLAVLGGIAAVFLRK